MSNKRAHVFVSGLVQGVFYRSTTAETAIGLGLTGWVRNLDDGRVELVAEGEEDKVAELVDWCHYGPPASKVDSVRVEWSDATGEFFSFSVATRHG